MATYANISGVIECTGTDITSEGIAGFLDANPALGACTRFTTGVKDVFVFNLSANLRIGNTTSGPTASIWDASNQFIHISRQAPDAFHIHGLFQMGDMTDGASTAGGALSVECGFADRWDIRDGGKVRLYGSHVYADDRIVLKDGAEFTAIDCDCELEDGVSAGQDNVNVIINFTRSRIHHTGGVGIKAFATNGATNTFTNARVEKCSFAIQPIGTMTFENLSIDSCWRHVVANVGDTNITFINPDFTALRLFLSDLGTLAAIEYRYGLTVTDVAGSPLQGVAVRLTDASGSHRFNTITDASGRPTTFPEATYQNATYVGDPNDELGATRTEREAHTLRVRGMSYLWGDYPRSATANLLADRVPVVTDTLFSLPNFDGTTISGVTVTDHGVSLVSWNSKSWGITITGNRTTNPTLTAQVLYHVLKYYGSLPATWQGKSGLDWHQMMPSLTTTARSSPGYYNGTVKGVRVIDQAGNPFPGVTQMQADDGTFYVPPTTATVTFSGFPVGSDVVILTAGTNTILAHADD